METVAVIVLLLSLDNFDNSYLPESISKCILPFQSLLIHYVASKYLWLWLDKFAIPILVPAVGPPLLPASPPLHSASSERNLALSHSFKKNYKAEGRYFGINFLGSSIQRDFNVLLFVFNPPELQPLLEPPAFLVDLFGPLGQQPLPLFLVTSRLPKSQFMLYGIWL